MKKFVLAVLLALPLLGLTQQKAAAWYRFNWSAGFNLCYERGGDTCYLGGRFQVHDPRIYGGYGGWGDGGYGFADGGGMQYYPAYDRGIYHTGTGDYSGHEVQPSFPPAPKPADGGGSKEKTSSTPSGAWYYGS